MQKQTPQLSELKSSRNMLLFVLPSLLGIFLFMTPMMFEGGLTIPIAVLKDALLSALGGSAGTVVAAVLIVSAIFTIVASVFKPKALLSNEMFNDIFNISAGWAATRVIGAAFVAMVVAGVGPEAVISDNTGSFVFAELMPSLLAVFIFAGLLLPLLTHFGLLEMIGSLLTRVMRPLFNLPGRSAIDCMASWLGDGSVGILMSSKQYEEKRYTQREAAVIGTTFSAVSISFSLVVIAQVKLEHLFIPFYATVCLAGVIVAIIVPRLPPLSNKKDLLIDGSKRLVDTEVVPEGQSVLSYGLQNALTVTSKIDSVASVAKVSVKNALDMVFGVLPVVMAVGTIGLIVSEYTPIFTWLGMPFVPFLELLQVPLAQPASETMVVGFVDMFIPSIIAASFDSEMTRFVVAALSVTQLIFLSEVGALLLGSKIPVNLLEMFIIFLLRTVISLPVIAGMAHLIF
ncbi:YjiH family protein [Ferrimonas aestuarii]|uniref:YjiH family protein n=1 Tax=Ferrimonas aestuarii TaxID=2569539 RepID=A0A4U1BLD0_9GAMM|nr:YjiH family protein [Ferrimonas aestuarii]TKB52762.1 YjiH family protein [Ferrimonas aestuarii]